MKRNRILVPVVLAAMLFASFYMLYNTRNEIARQYEQHLKQAREYASMGVAVDAFKHYVQALELDNTLEINLEVGEFFVQVEDYVSAIGWGEQLVEKYPTKAEGYAFLLNLYRENSDYNRCYALYETISKRELVNEEISTIMKDIQYVYYYEEGFDDVGVYSNGLCPVMSEEKWGMVDEKGIRVVSCKYESIGSFMSDVAPVKTFDGEVYYIDSQGNKKIVVQGVDKIVELSPMLNDVFSVFDGETWTYYSSKFEKLSEGYDSVSVTGNFVAAIEKEGYFSLIDNKMQEVNKEKYIDVVSDERGIVYRNNVLFVFKDGNYYMINKEGEKIGSETYKEAKLFNDSTYAAVKDDKGWYFIDNAGKSVFENLYFQDAHSFLNGFAAVKVKGQWGFIDMQGNVVIDCIFEDVKDFSTSGTVFVQSDNVWQLLKLYSKNYSK